MERDQFFEHWQKHGMALAFKDVKVDSAASEFTAGEVDVSTRISRNIYLKIPLVTSAMLDVTESRTAIAIAQAGGIGVVHNALSADRQKDEVRRVKHFLNGLIEAPITVSGDMYISEVHRLYEEKDYPFRTFPVEDNDGRFAGLITGAHLNYWSSPEDRVSDVMTPKDRIFVADKGTTIDEAYRQMKSTQSKCLPLLDQDGKVDGLYVISDVHRIISGNSGQYNLDSKDRLRVAAAVSTRTSPLEQIQKLSPWVDAIVIDTAHGDSRFVIPTLQEIKHSFPNIDVVAGNVTNPASARDLALAGADGVKVGQGSGSICTTGEKTATGTTQLMAVYECSKAVEDLDVPICSDGGIRNDGDVVKALYAGADSVMMGRMFAGTVESPGKPLYYNGRQYKRYRGMGSAEVMKITQDARGYSDGSSETPLEEGVSGLVPFDNESVITVANRIVQAVAKALSYGGAPDIKERRRAATWRRLTQAAIEENQPHDIVQLPAESLT